MESPVESRQVEKSVVKALAASRAVTAQHRLLGAKPVNQGPQIPLKVKLRKRFDQKPVKVRRDEQYSPAMPIEVGTGLTEWRKAVQVTLAGGPADKKQSTLYVANYYEGVTGLRFLSKKSQLHSDRNGLPRPRPGEVHEPIPTTVVSGLEHVFGPLSQEWSDDMRIQMATETCRAYRQLVVIIRQSSPRAPTSGDAELNRLADVMSGWIRVNKSPFLPIRHLVFSREGLPDLTAASPSSVAVSGASLRYIQALCSISHPYAVSMGVGISLDSSLLAEFDYQGVTFWKGAAPVEVYTYLHTIDGGPAAIIAIVSYGSRNDLYCGPVVDWRSVVAYIVLTVRASHPECFDWPRPINARKAMSTKAYVRKMLETSWEFRFSYSDQLDEFWSNQRGAVTDVEDEANEVPETATATGALKRDPLPAQLPSSMKRKVDGSPHQSTPGSERDTFPGAGAIKTGEVDADVQADGDANAFAYDKRIAFEYKVKQELNFQLPESLCDRVKMQVRGFDTAHYPRFIIS
ncbi:hypothetical protein IAT38_001392 [Cryptococcus sp. DSM 104549]